MRLNDYKMLDFKRTPEEQLKELVARSPEKDYQRLSPNPGLITREYRRIIMRPALVNLIDRNVCRPGRDDATRFELAHVEIIKWTLGFELPGKPEWRIQSKRVDQLKVEIRDISFPIPQVPLSMMWESIKNQHQLRSIVFECKNYSDGNPITFQEVYQLFQYINPSQHGYLGILLSRNGDTDLSANSAIKKISELKEEEYRILVLSDDDIVQMIDEFVESGTCATFLYQQIEKSRNYPK